MLGGPPFDTLTPHMKRAALHVLAHDRADLIFFQTKLHLNGLKRRPVFPGHLNDAVNDVRSEIRSFGF